MLLKYINSNRLSVIIVFSLLPVVYWMPSLFAGASDHIAPATGVLFGRWIISFNSNFRAIASLIALLLIILNGYLLIQLNTIHIFIPFRTQLPFFFYVILALSITQLHHLTPELISSTLVILVFYRIFNAYKTDGISINFLDAGLLVSVASLFYFPSILFFFFLLAGIALIRPFIWREWVFALLGLILPYVFVISGYYLLNLPVSDLFHGISEAFNRVPKDLRLSQIVNWCYMLLFTMISSYYIALAMDGMKIHSRKFFMVFLVCFLFSLLIFFVIAGAGAGMVYFIAAPMAYLFSYYFVKCKQKLAE